MKWSSSLRLMRLIQFKKRCECTKYKVMKKIIVILFLFSCLNMLGQEIKIDSIRILSPKTFFKEKTVKEKDSFKKEFMRIADKYKTDRLPCLYFYSDGLVYLTAIKINKTDRLPIEKQQIL